MKRLLLAGVLAATAALGGCVVAPAGPVAYYPPAVRVYPAPPPPVVVYPRPYYGYGYGHGYGRGYGYGRWGYRGWH
jgi:hypothetical protein